MNDYKRSPRSEIGPTLAVIALLACTVGIGGCDLLVGADTRVARAEAHVARGDYRSALVELKTALERNPDHVRARTALARLSLDLGDAESAQKELDRALQAGANREQLRPLAVEILLTRREFDAAIRTLERDQSIPEVQRKTLLSAAQLGLEHYGEAEHSIAEALRVAPDDAQALLQQAHVLAKQNRPDSALQSVDHAIQQNDQLAEAWLMRGNVLLQQGSYREAIESFGKGLNTNRLHINLPQELALLSGLGNAQLVLKDKQGAADTLARLKTRFPKAIPTGYLRARFALLNDDYPEAVSELQLVLQAVPDYLPARVLLGAARISQGTLEQAEAELSELVAEHPDNLQARKLLAHVYLARRQPDAARRTLAGAGDSVEADAQLEWLMGAALLQTGSEDAGIAHLERSFSARPDNTNARLELARAYLSAGRRQDAIALLDGLSPEAAGGARAKALLLLANITGKEGAEQRRAVDELVASHTDDSVLLGVAGTYALNVDDLKRARQYLNRSAKLDPRNVACKMSLAQLEFLESNLEAAEQQLREVLEIDPKQQGAYLGLSGLAWLRSDRVQSRQLLERAIAADPAAVQARLRLAQLAFIDGDPKRARALLEQALTVAADRVEILTAVGEVLMHGGQLDDALARFTEAAEAGSQRATINVARAQLALGRSEDARYTLESALTVRAVAPQAAVMLVQLDIRQGRVQEAQQRASRLNEFGLPLFAINELQGDVSMAARRFDVAARSYSNAARERPGSLLTVKTFRALEASRTPRPESVLVSRLEASPGDRVVRLVLAEYHQRSGNRREAIAQYEQLAKVANADPTVLNNLAWLYYESGDKRAPALAQEAYEIAPNVGAIADTYGWILFEGGDVARGLGMLEKAAEQAPNNVEIRYHLAAARAAAGDKDSAVEILTTLLQSKEDFAWRGNAEELLRTLRPQYKAGT